MEFKEILRFLLIIPTLWITFFILTGFHELGHAVGYLLASRGKGPSWYIKIGKGEPFLKLERLRVGHVPVMGSFRVTEPFGKLSRKTRLATLAGGPLASLVLIVILLGLRSLVADEVFREYLKFMYHWTLVGFFLTALPLTYPSWLGEVRYSDGRQILHLLQQREEE